MLDLLALAVTLGFFALCGALIRLAEKLMPEPPRAPSPDPAATGDRRDR
jgi:hypothetical protein